MMQLPHNPPSVMALPNGWTQVSFTLNLPFTLELGARLQWGETLLAPWRVQDAHIDCLCMTAPNNTARAAIELVHAGQPLPHLDSQQPLLIMGEDLGIADALRTAGQLKKLAAHSLVLLSADQFPCIIKPAKFMLPELPELIACCPLLEDWGFANRLASKAGLVGCFDGSLSELVAQLGRDWQKLHYQAN